MTKITPRFALLAVSLLLVAGLLFWNQGGGYRAQVQLDSATNLVKGGPVLVNGFEAGKVTDIEVVDGKALVSFEIDDKHAPLHDGAQIEVDWKAALSERRLSISDGPGENAEVPDGGMVRGDMPKPMEIDEVLNSLDAPTRKKLQSLTARLSQTLKGNEGDLRSTVAGAGPTIDALGELLKALGTDGPAIKHLVKRVDGTMQVLAARDEEIEQIVTDLGTLTSTLAARRTSLRTSLQKLPGTLKQAKNTLDKVPGTADEAVPLLEDLDPATESLKPVAKNLTPVLKDLRPLTAELRPTLSALESLLQITPGLLDTTTTTLPSLTKATEDLRKPLDFIRPYIPEIVAYPSLWASAFANYDSYGNFARLNFAQGPTSFNENPGIVPPGITHDPYPVPGALVGQPWKDATGSEMR